MATARNEDGFLAFRVLELVVMREFVRESTQAIVNLNKLVLIIELHAYCSELLDIMLSSYHSDNALNWILSVCADISWLIFDVPPEKLYQCSYFCRSIHA